MTRNEAAAFFFCTYLVGGVFLGLGIGLLIEVTGDESLWELYNPLTIGIAGMIAAYTMGRKKKA